MAGHCDQENNSRACHFDGGDCCFSTCEDGLYSCAVIACDEKSECKDPDGNNDGCVAAQADPHMKRRERFPDCDHETRKLEWAADGQCDPPNNVVECGYDGGDCCASTCVDKGGGMPTCQEAGVCAQDCRDPAGSQGDCL